MQPAFDGLKQRIGGFRGRIDQLDQAVRAPFDVKRADQLSTGQFILDQGFDTDGNAQSFDDRVQGKVSAFELQSAISINFFFVGEIQPVFPIGSIV